MAHTRSRSIAAIPVEGSTAVDTHSGGLVAEEMCLRDLRKSRGLTQTDLARRLHRGQELVSRIEQRQDLLLSTLRTYVSSLGGELDLICRFADRAPVRIRTTAGSTSSVPSESPAATGQGGLPLIAQHQS